MPSPLEQMAALLRSARPPDREEGWYTAGEIAKELGETESSVMHRLRRQAKAGEIDCKEATVLIVGKRLRANVYRVKP